MTSGSGKKKPRWRENLSLKLISLILAVMLELYFYSPDNSLTVSLPITIEVRNVPSSMMFISPRNGERGIPGRIEVRGPRPLIEQVRTANHRYVIDYPQDQRPVYSVPIDARQLWLPAGVEVLEVHPHTLTVELEKSVQRRIPIEFDGNGSVAQGFQMEKVTLTPDFVIVNGPASEVNPLKAIKTERLSVEGLNDTRRFEVPLINPGMFTKLDVQTINVEVQVGYIPAERTFEKVNIKVVAPYGYAGTVEPSRVKCTVSGTKENLEKLDIGAIQLQADGRELVEGRHEVAPSATLPDGIRLLAIDPKKVTVHLVKK